MKVSLPSKIEMNSLMDPSRHFISNAVIIKCCVSDPKFDVGLALWCAGMDIHEARKINNQTVVSNCLEPVRKGNPIVINERSIPNLVERAKILVSHATRVPRKIGKNGIVSIDEMESTEKGSASIADYCFLAGFSSCMLQGKTKPQYQLVYNFRVKYVAQKIAPLTSTAPSYSHFDQRPLQHIAIDSIDTTLTPQIMSPLPEGVSNEESLQQFQRLSAGRLDESRGVAHQLISPSSGPSFVSNLSDGFSASTQNSTSQDSTAASNSNKSTSTHLVSYSSERSKSNNDFSKKVNASVFRKTSQQAHRERHDQKVWEMLKDSAYEISTKMYDRLRKKKLPLSKFSSAESIATFVNEGFECDLISGEMIRQAYKKDYVGEAPQRVGRKPKVSREDSELLSSLLFSANSIDQANSDASRMNRQDQISTIGRIVNSKREDDGQDILDDAFYFLKHIEPKLSLSSSVEKLDKRELLRLMWLTYEQQKKHYINWEHYLVEYNFGRFAESAEETSTHGNVVFYPESLDRMIHIDEMGFSYDGSKNGIGGRVAAYFSNPDAPEAGIATAKSSLKISILFGATYAGNPIPPLIVLPNKAKKPKIELELLYELHQIKGVFGYKEERHFNCLIGKKKTFQFTYSKLTKNTFAHLPSLL